MPTAPVHHGRSASHAITRSASRCSCSVYSSSRIPEESPLPRRSTRANANPCAAKYVPQAASPIAVPSLLRYGTESRIDRHGAAVGVLGKPQPDRQAHPVGQLDPVVLHDAGHHVAGNRALKALVATDELQGVGTAIGLRTPSR